MPEFLLEIENLSFAYPSGPQILDNINFTLAGDEAIELSGPNGCGKTTLFRCLTGLEKNWQGTIRLAGKTVRSEKDFQNLRKHVAYSLQNAEDQLFFPSVIEDVSFGPLNLGLSETQAREVALATLELLGIAKLADALSYKLSGGQQKLVALAAVLAMRPQALLLDEPLNGLDADASRRLYAALEKLECAKIIVAHDTQIFKKLCSRRLELKNGRLEAGL